MLNYGKQRDLQTPLQFNVNLFTVTITLSWLTGEKACFIISPWKELANDRKKKCWLLSQSVFMQDINDSTNVIYKAHQMIFFQGD